MKTLYAIGRMPVWLCPQRRSQQWNTGRSAMVPDRPWGHQEHLGWKESLSESRLSVWTSGAGDQDDLHIHVNFNWLWDIFRPHFPNCIKPHSIFMTKMKKKNPLKSTMLCDWSTPFLALPPPHLSSQPAALLRSDLLSWYPEEKSAIWQKPLLRDSYPFYLSGI